MKIEIFKLFGKTTEKLPNTKKPILTRGGLRFTALDIPQKITKTPSQGGCHIFFKWRVTADCE